MLADMHTHSESSHDSVCKIEDMCNAQIKAGTAAFAVTDHFNTSEYGQIDIFAPIQKACDRAFELNEKFGDKLTVLRGIELGDGFLDHKVYEKAISLCEYDVVIGSVHVWKNGDGINVYSTFDFSAVSFEESEKIVDGYFDDIITIVQTQSIDILAHLTYPLRYINGKYKVGIGLSKYEKKIEKILCIIIEKGIALEVNTSSVDTLGALMPPIDIIKKYYDMGGRLITLGSDAHAAENASKAFGETVEALKKIGFKNIYWYKSRKPIAIEI